jgi:hypothetical protein
MIWLTWRQHRAEWLGAALVLAALGGLLLLTGVPMHRAYENDGVASCLTDAVGGGEDCLAVLDLFRHRYVPLGDRITLLNVLPALVGVFFGAPLLGREFEHGTWRLVWTQGVGRTKWLAVKVAVLTAAVTAMAVGYTALLTWWRGPLDAIQGRFDGAAYNFEGAAPVATALFAFALGTFAGTLIRRTIPAMAVTFFGYWLIRLPVELWLRPRFRTPLTRITDFPTRPVTFDASPSPTAQPGLKPSIRANTEWVLDRGWIDQAGHRLTFSEENALMRAARDAAVEPGTYLHQQGIRQFVLYHPGDRFWTFQLFEAAIFLGLAAALLLAAAWLVHRRPG